MQIDLKQVAVGRPGRPILPPTTLSTRSGAVTVQACPTDQAPSVLALVASGRMRPTSGVVLLDGVRARRRIQRRMAIIDAPAVCAPDDFVTLRSTIEEEFTYVGRVATPGRVRAFLDDLHLSEYGNHPMIELPPLVRVTALTEIALLRPGVEGVVAVTPDRHGGSAREFFDYFRTIADRGVAVLLITGTAAARNLLREVGEGPDTTIRLSPLEEAVPLDTFERLGIPRSDEPDAPARKDQA